MEALLTTDLGMLATRCTELAVAQECGVTFTLADLTAEEFTGLPTARQELERWRQERNEQK